MAEGIMRKKIQERNVIFEVDSAGTSNYHVGDAPDKRAINKMKKYNADISTLRGRQFTVNDFDEFQLILTMDESNYQNVIKLARNEEDKKRVQMILNFVNPESNQSVPDPYYGTDADFEEVYHMLNNACEKILNKYLPVR
jgi:protein-tyrosine phosphatase